MPIFFLSERGTVEMIVYDWLLIRAYLHRGASAVPSLSERVEICVGRRSSTRVSPGIAGPARLRAAARRPVRSSHLYHHLAGRICLSLAFCPPHPSSSFLASAVLTLADLIVTAALPHALGDSFAQAYIRKNPFCTVARAQL
jgi:hypothetical protein